MNLKLISILAFLTVVDSNVTDINGTEFPISNSTSPEPNRSSGTSLVEAFQLANRLFNYSIIEATSDPGKVMKIKGTRKPVERPAQTEKPVEKKRNYTLQWIAQPLRKAFADFRVYSPTNEKCNSDVRMYVEHLKNDTLWAVRMFESSQMDLSGLIGGTSYQMGNFEECVNTAAFGVKGKYCLANFKFRLNEEDDNYYKSIVPQDDFNVVSHKSSVWEGLERLKRDPVRIDRQNVFWGLCFPASCSNEDLAYTLNQTLVPNFVEHGIEINVSVDPIYCHTLDNKPYTKGFFITAGLMITLLLVNILSTLYDFYEFLKGSYTSSIDGWRELVGTFSIWRNTYNLGIYDKSTQVKAVNVMKLIMMLFIIYGHGLLYILGTPQYHPESLEEVYRRGADIALVNTNVVDIFFAVSGFLTFYYGYQPMKLGGTVYLVLSIVFRYLRLMPVFAVVIAYVVNILPYTSDGPIWNSRIMIETNNCRKNWWLDLLLLNNVINVDEQCFIISWYITTDMLLCIIASILTFVMIKKPKLGLFMTFFVFFLSVFVTFTITYRNRYNGLLKLYMSFLEEPRKSVEYRNVYTALYSRAGPYLVGFLTGYLTIKLQEQKFKFSKRAMFIGSALTIAIAEGSQYYGVVFYKFDRPYNLLENALYACLHRVLFAGIAGWFLLSYLTTGFGIMDAFFNHRIFTILGRITYSVFLMNTLSLLTIMASMRTPVYNNYKMIGFLILGDAVVTYILGFLFYLYAEAPICGISKLLQKTLAKMFSKEIEMAKQKAALNSFSQEKKVTYGS